MKLKDYKYEVALSFATEDIDIARSIHLELDRLGITNYFFPKKNNEGKNLRKESTVVYSTQSMFVLMIVSQNYVKKNWSTEERKIMQMVSRPEGVPYIIPMRIDDTKVDGLTDDIVYMEWKNENASSIAISLYRHVRLSNYQFYLTGSNNVKSTTPKKKKKKGKKIQKSIVKAKKIKKLEIKSKQ